MVKGVKKEVAELEDIDEDYEEEEEEDIFDIMDEDEGICSGIFDSCPLTNMKDTVMGFCPLIGIKDKVKDILSKFLD